MTKINTQSLDHAVSELERLNEERPNTEWGHDTDYIRVQRSIGRAKDNLKELREED